MADPSSSLKKGTLAQPRPASYAKFPSVLLPVNLITRVTDPKCYSFYGAFDKEFLVRSTSEFVSSHTDADSIALSKVLADFFETSHTDCIMTTSPENRPLAGEACWVVIRLGHATDYFATPRWHQDGNMFDCSCVEPRTPHAKYAITLLGPSTLILEPCEPMMEAFASVQDPWLDENRAELAEKLASFDRVPIRAGEVIRFSWGQEDSPVHSEPDSRTEDRVFMSILFGSEIELRVMCEWREEEYGKVDI